MKDTVKTAWPLFPLAPSYWPGGAVEQQSRQHLKDVSAATDRRDAAVNEQIIPAIIGLSMLGVGAGLTGTKLYNIVSGFNKPKEKYTKFGPGPQRLDEEEKLAANPPPTAPPPPKFRELTSEQQAMLLPMALFTTGLGMYGGNALVRMIESKKRKENIQQDLEDARGDYQRALTGKRAEALDSAFLTYKTVLNENLVKKAAGEQPGLLETGADLMTWPLKVTGVWPWYVTAVLGTGALAGKMTYDWTRERSKDKALERAQRSRARMEENAPLYIDPAQLEGIKALHQKEIDKVKQKEIV